MILNIPHSTIIRNITAFVIAVTTFFWAGKMMQSQGYGGFLLAFFLLIVVPLIVCLIATRYVVFYGIVTNICIVLSLVREDARYYAHSAEFWDSFWRRDVYFLLIIILFAITVSLPVSISVYLEKRKAEQIIRREAK